MIVCSCNALSDRDILALLARAEPRPTVSQIYAGLGCRARCGRCTPTIKELREEASGCDALRQAAGI
jgi:bacterioferritin-associated ferredoxin